MVFFLQITVIKAKAKAEEKEKDEIFFFIAGSTFQSLVSYVRFSTGSNKYL